MSFLPEHIESRLREEIERRGLHLLDLKRRGERGTTVIEIVVDGEEGVTLDMLSQLSRFAALLLDEEEDAIPGRYKLEVSSAGLDRPLEHLWQYRKNIGRLVKLVFDDESGKRLVEIFRLTDIADGSLIVEPKIKRPKSTPEPIAIPLERIARATIEPQF